MSLAYISHHKCQLHDMGDYHPEQPARLAAINDRLIATGLDMALRQHDAQPVRREQLLAAHGESYVSEIFRKSPEFGSVAVDPDTRMNPFSLEAALHATGAVTQGVDLVMSGEVDKVFCGVRPPGHHAERNRAMGFCLFNNVAVGAYHALEQHSLDRVAIVDFDVHHGNGTEDIVAGDERILFCSSFQHPFYPHSGDNSSAANVINSPLPGGSGGDALRQVVSSQWLPQLSDFQPQLIFISAGFDGHQADPLADFRLVDEDFAWVTRQLCAQADASASGRVVSSLEGGYDLHALGRCVEAHLKAMLEY